jgi:Phage terminase small subunit.
MAVIFYSDNIIVQFCSIFNNVNMAKDLSRESKKKLAKELYLSGKHNQKDIAKMVEISERSLSKWVNEGKWELLRANLTTTKESVLSNWYAQLAEMNKTISEREPGKRFPSSGESDRMIKISAAIKKLETETGIAEITSVCISLCEFVRTYDVEKAKEISDHFNAFIEYKMK